MFHTDHTGIKQEPILNTGGQFDPNELMVMMISSTLAQKSIPYMTCLTMDEDHVDQFSFNKTRKSTIDFRA